jgi:hypothetical protein
VDISAKVPAAGMEVLEPHGSISFAIGPSAPSGVDAGFPRLAAVSPLCLALNSPALGLLLPALLSVSSESPKRPSFCVLRLIYKLPKKKDREES